MALFPGNYEISTQAKGLESDIQKIVIKAGDNPGVETFPASRRRS